MKMSIMTAFVLAASLSCNAAEFSQVQPAKSSISFISKQMGVPIEGHFGKFTAKISFDPDSIATSNARIEIYMASIDAGSSDANDEVKGKDWFDIRAYPTATFVSTGIKALPGGRYAATGNMNIKGITRAITVPFSAKFENNVATLEGSMAISRLQYGVGGGEWADPDTVADEVQLRFRFTIGATRQ